MVEQSEVGIHSFLYRHKISRRLLYITHIAVSGALIFLCPLSEAEDNVSSTVLVPSFQGRMKSIEISVSNSSYQSLQKQYKKIYGMSYEDHNRQYAGKRTALRALYQHILQHNKELQKQVHIVENIIAPLTLADVLLALAKVESSYNPLAIGAHGEASIFQLAPRFASSKGLKIYNWKKFQQDRRRYGIAYARRLHTRDLKELIARYRQNYPPTNLLQELSKEDDRFNPRKVVQLMIDHLVKRIKWLYDEGIAEILPLVFIGHNGGIGRLKRFLSHLQSKGASLEESYTLLSRGLRRYTHKLLVDLALTHHQRLLATTEGYF